MISGELIKNIEEKINKLKIDDYSYIKNNIKLLDLDDVDINKNNYGFIDSSFINGIIGPFSYIYSRAVIVSDNIYEKIDDIEILPNIFFKTDNDTIDINDVSSLFAKNLEYKLASKYIDNYIFFDGSIISDSILFSKFNTKIYDELIEKRKEEYLNNFKYIINNGKIIAIAKRILNLNIYNLERSDMIALMKIYPNQIFYTDIVKKNLKEYLMSKINDNIFDRNINILYFRARVNDHIYRLESLDNININKLKEIIKEEIYKDFQYPKFLKLAHNLCKITNKEKFSIENYMKKLLGYEYSVSWETH
ncbi:DNA double-strand break repair nuclease NurA [Nanobdella aerobiophila]|uniref:DNA double-strand break repair nuclease NurA n=1 Tax=Nanobdella aerobiophila TaxID=2586965 RepID=UPI0021AD21E6|nr:DNA double-strand break repair nuclease NurA [Nanobdella aerobiophila]